MKIKSSKINRYQFNKTGESRCAICGGLSNITNFKNGYICESCLQYVKTL